jgi:hypothetical protein
VTVPASVIDPAAIPTRCVRHDGAVDRTAARRYLLRIFVLTGAPLLFALGTLVAVVGAPEVGVPALLIAMVAWVAVVTWAWTAAMQERDGKNWFGPRSVSEDANARMGWSQLPQAATAIGLPSEVIRRTLVTTIVLALVMVAAAVALGVTIRQMPLPTGEIAPLP